jgi:hypothetical protein
MNRHLGHAIRRGQETALVPERQWLPVKGKRFSPFCKEAPISKKPLRLQKICGWRGFLVMAYSALMRIYKVHAVDRMGEGGKWLLLVRIDESMMFFLGCRLIFRVGPRSS